MADDIDPEAGGIRTEPVTCNPVPPRAPPADWPGTPEEYSAALDWCWSQIIHVSFRGGGGTALFADPAEYLTAVLGRPAPPSTRRPVDPAHAGLVTVTLPNPEDYDLVVYGRRRRPPA